MVPSFGSVDAFKRFTIDKTMKILQVITSMLTGGAEHIVVELSLALKKRGHEVGVALFDGEDTPFKQQLIDGGIKVYPFYRKGNVYNPFNIYKLIRVMQHYDVVHSHNSSPQFFVALANVVCHKLLITTEHSTNNRKRNMKVFRRIDVWMYKQYSFVVCISDVAKQILCNYLKITDNVVVINNGIDVDAIKHALPLENEKLSRQFVVTMVAGFREAKDQDTLVRSLTSLPSFFVVWLVGIGTREAELKQLVTHLGLQQRVRFWGLRMDVPQILKTSDVIVMSSHWEGLSLSNLEGMAAGKPFVASNVDGLRQITSGAGLLFPEGDYKSLAAILQRLHDDKSFYTETAHKCYVRAKEYDVERMVDQYEALYNKMMEQ